LGSGDEIGASGIVVSATALVTGLYQGTNSAGRIGTGFWARDKRVSRTGLYQGTTLVVPNRIT
jgi:hypothetical protein